MQSSPASDGSEFPYCPGDYSSENEDCEYENAEHSSGNEATVHEDVGNSSEGNIHGSQLVLSSSGSMDRVHAIAKWVCVFCFEEKNSVVYDQIAQSFVAIIWCVCHVLEVEPKSSRKCLNVHVGLSSQRVRTII